MAKYVKHKSLEDFFLLTGKRHRYNEKPFNNLLEAHETSWLLECAWDLDFEPDIGQKRRKRGRPAADVVLTRSYWNDILDLVEQDKDDIGTRMEREKELLEATAREKEDVIQTSMALGVPKILDEILKKRGGIELSDADRAFIIEKTIAKMEKLIDICYADATSRFKALEKSDRKNGREHDYSMRKWNYARVISVSHALKSIEKANFPRNIADIVHNEFGDG